VCPSDQTPALYGLGSIQGITSASPELTDFITRLHEKFAEESFRSIFKVGAKTTKASETDDYDVERKAFKVEIQALKDERNRLEKLCLDRHIDPRSRKQKASDKEREQAADDPSRNSSRQRDTTRSTRPGAATRNDKRRQHVDGHENADDDNELDSCLRLLSGMTICAARMSSISCRVISTSPRFPPTFHMPRSYVECRCV
jgi:hypothetical protein